MLIVAAVFFPSLQIPNFPSFKRSKKIEKLHTIFINDISLYQIKVVSDLQHCSFGEFKSELVKV